jgi:hypothetical protein
MTFFRNHPEQTFNFNHKAGKREFKNSNRRPLKSFSVKNLLIPKDMENITAAAQHSN